MIHVYVNLLLTGSQEGEYHCISCNRRKKFNIEDVKPMVIDMGD